MTDVQFIQRAREEYGRDGEIEIEEGAVVSRGSDRSRGSDPGAYVQAWVWVSDPEGEEE